MAMAAKAIFRVRADSLKYGGGLCNHGNRGLKSRAPVVSSRALSVSASLHHARSQVPVGLIKPGEEDKIFHSRLPQLEIPEMNIADFVWKDSDKYADDVALVCGMTGRSYKYGMAKGMATKFGSAIIRSGLVPGDVMGMVVPNLPEFPIAFLGAVGAGITLTTMNPTYRAEELAKQLANSEAKAVMTIGMFLPNVKQAVEICGGGITIIVLGMEDTPSDCVPFLDMVLGDDGSLYKGETEVDPHSHIATLPYSSGTTGPPKGVCVSHFNLVANLLQITSTQPYSLTKGHPSHHGGQDVSVAVLPFFHIYAQTVIMLGQMREGNKVITLPKFEPETYIKALVNYKPTVLHLVPPLVSFLATNPAVKSQHLESVNAVTGGAAPFGPTLLQQFTDKIGKKVDFREGFGMSESSPLTICQPNEDNLRVSGSCGEPVANTIAKIVDTETGEILGKGERGEICVSGPQVMLGYKNNPSATAETIKDGWLMTGDVAEVDENGQFFIVDRLKELIKVKGLQVSPSELEDLIRRHPGVLDVAVIGVPDERDGECPRAYVIRKNKNVLEQSIVDWVAEKAAPHKKLTQGVMFVDSLPKNQTGKILRRELKAQVFKGSFGY